MESKDQKDAKRRLLTLRVVPEIHGIVAKVFQETEQEAGFAKMLQKPMKFLEAILLPFYTPEGRTHRKGRRDSRPRQSAGLEKEEQSGSTGSLTRDLKQLLCSGGE